MNSCSIDDNIRIGGQLSQIKNRFHYIVKPKRNKTKLAVMLTTLLFILTFCVTLSKSCSNSVACQSCYQSGWRQHILSYPSSHSPQIIKQSDNSLLYKIVLVADLDERSRISRETEVWHSYLLQVDIQWDGDKNFDIKVGGEPVSIKSDYSRGGRGMELSEIVYYNSDFISVDDRTGIIFKLKKDKKGRWIAIPWVVLTDGPGDEIKGFKGEWMTVKDGKVYVGGLGKEWTTVDGEYVNDHPMYIKIISSEGGVEHKSWIGIYKALRHALNISSPGYIIHESVLWSEQLRKWIILPRRVSTEMYNEVKDERRASNVLFICSENFEDIQVKRVGKIKPTRGYSSFKFLPETKDRIIVAIKSEEDKGKVSTYLTIFDISGRIFLNDFLLANEKYEGMEFL